MTLHRFADLGGWELEDSDKDIRGRRLLAPTGEEVGVIKDFMVDLDRERVAAVVTDQGESYATESLEIGDDCVRTHGRPISGATSDFASAGERPATVAVYDVRLVRPR